MPAYIDEIEFAVRSLIPALWAERERVVELEDVVSSLTTEMERNYEQVERITQSEVPDDDGLATMVYWETYFGPDKERNQKALELGEAERTLEAHQFSVAALAGALLQHAKQGISIVHGAPSNAPSGRTIGSLALRTIIWEGRNQAIHWEEGGLRAPGQKCFSTLAREQGPQFNQHAHRSLAMDVVELLGWRDFESFADDMNSLA